jgi:hypothetical protein
MKVECLPYFPIDLNFKGAVPVQGRNPFHPFKEKPYFRIENRKSHSILLNFFSKSNIKKLGFNHFSPPILEVLTLRSYLGCLYPSQSLSGWV